MCKICNKKAGHPPTVVRVRPAPYDFANSLLLLATAVTVTTLCAIGARRVRVALTEVAAVTAILTTATSAEAASEAEAATAATLMAVTTRRLVIIRVLARLGLLDDETVAIDNTAVDGIDNVLSELVVYIDKREIAHDVDVADVDLRGQVAGELVDEADDVSRADGIHLTDIDEEAIHVLITRTGLTVATLSAVRPFAVV